jgi:hypothetical protein
VVRVAMKFLVQQAVAHGDVQQPVGQRRVAAGRELQM